MSNYLRVYEDSLEPRRHENTTLLWTSRELDPQVAFKQSIRPTPESHKEAVLKSSKIKYLIESLCKEQNISTLEVEKQVKTILDEIGYKKNLKVIRWLGYFLVKICLKVLSGIYVNHQSIYQVKSIMRNCPVVFVPSHRSYADFIMLSFVCFNYDIEIPEIAAGMDFHGMWGMGSVLRETGAFFMRRTYNDDNLYWNTFKQYIYQLTTKGDLPIEFFIEGTRSRSNKSITPKYGIILMILKALFFSEVPDILFVPVNISYDRLLEESLFAYELLGVPKPKESTSRFFKSMKILKEQFGNIYFHVDKPISAKEFFGRALDRSVHNLAALHQQELTETEKSLIPPLAYQIVRRQQESAVLTTFNLVCLVLNNNLTLGAPSLTVPELIEELYWMKSLLEALGAFVYEQDMSKGLEECLVVHSNLIQVSSDGGMCLVSNNIVLAPVNASNLKAHALSEKTMSYSIPFVTLQLYINPTLCYLIDIAVVVIVLKCFTGLNRGELFAHYHLLRTLFLLEFITYGDWEETEYYNAIQHLETLKMIEVSNSTVVLKNDTKLQTVLLSSIEPFIVSYFVTCYVLEKAPPTCDEKTILAKTQEVLEISVNASTKFIHPYCLSLDTLTNALNSFASLGCIKKSRRDNKNEYNIDQVLVKNMKEKIELYIPSFSVVKDFHIDFSMKNKL